MPVAEADGAKVIRAHVRARLLGLPLLTIDALVDVAPPRAGAEVRNGHVRRGARRRPRAAGPRLARADELLEQGGRSLDEAEALRRRLVSG